MPHLDERQGKSAPGWQAPALLNSWAYIGAPYNPPGYFIDVHGIVRLRGVVAGGVASGTLPIFVLPAGYCPANQELFVCNSNDAIGRVGVTNTGQVLLQVGSGAFVSLDGMTFKQAL